MNTHRPLKFGWADPPSVLFESLACHGYCIVEAANDTVVDAADVLAEWFEQPASVKQAAAVGFEAAAAGCGFFSLPDKEVLEVKQQWRPAGVKGAVRLPAKLVRNKRLFNAQSCEDNVCSLDALLHAVNASVCVTHSAAYMGCTCKESMHTNTGLMLSLAAQHAFFHLSGLQRAQLNGEQPAAAAVQWRCW
jgi:hypothetical protein